MEISGLLSVSEYLEYKSKILFKAINILLIFTNLVIDWKVSLKPLKIKPQIKKNVVIISFELLLVIQNFGGMNKNLLNDILSALVAIDIR